MDTDLKQKFLAELEAHKIPRYQHNYCLQWLSYYQKYCQEHTLQVQTEQAEQAYLQYLVNIKRSQFQRTQAQMALQLYRGLLATAAIISTPQPQPQSVPTTKTWPCPAVWHPVLQAMRQEIQTRHYSPKTLKSYTHWALRFIRFLEDKSPKQVKTQDLKQFLSHLATQQKVAATTQNQALNALVFLFKQGLKRPPGPLKGMTWAKNKPRIPVVLTPTEIQAIWEKLDSPYNLIVKLLYGSGLRLSECLALRIQDLDLEQGLIFVHRGKGGKDRTVPLPQAILGELETQFQFCQTIHAQDFRLGVGAFIESAPTNRKLDGKTWPWQWLFPAKQLTYFPELQSHQRYHLHPSHVQKAIKTAVHLARIPKRASAHTFRHSFASHLLQANVDIKTIQELLGHSHLQTTLIYTHTVKSSTQKNPISPLDLSFQAQSQAVNR